MQSALTQTIKFKRKSRIAKFTSAIVLTMVTHSAYAASPAKKIADILSGKVASTILPLIAGFLAVLTLFKTVISKFLNGTSDGLFEAALFVLIAGWIAVDYSGFVNTLITPWLK